MGESTGPELEPSRVRRSRVWRTVATVLISTLLGTISLLIAWLAFQASTYGDESARLAATANQMGVDSLHSAQEDYAVTYLTDVEVWLRILQSGQDWETHPMKDMLSASWLDALDRAEVLGSGSAELPVDEQYWKEIQADAEATRLAQANAAGEAQAAGATSKRSTYGRDGDAVSFPSPADDRVVGCAFAGVRIALAIAATVILVIALRVGSAEIRLPW